MAYIKTVCLEDWQRDSQEDGHTVVSPEYLMLAQEMIDLGYDPESIDEEAIQAYLAL